MKIQDLFERFGRRFVLYTVITNKKDGNQYILEFFEIFFNKHDKDFLIKSRVIIFYNEEIINRGEDYIRDINDFNSVINSSDISRIRSLSSMCNISIYARDILDYSNEIIRLTLDYRDRSILDKEKSKAIECFKRFKRAFKPNFSWFC